MPRTISTTTSTGITLTSTSDNPVSVTGTITVSTGAALYGTGGGASPNSWTIDNSGLVSSTDSGSGGIAVGSESSPVVEGVVTNRSTGTISGGKFGVSMDLTGSVTNAGAISGSSYGIYLGSFGYSPDAGSVINQSGGTIHSRHTGVWISGSGAVTNLSDGTISGDYNPAIDIRGYGQSGNQTGVQVYNAGTLSGTGGVYEYRGGSVTNAAGGAITGTSGSAIDLRGNGIVINAGAVNGNAMGVNLYEGGSITNLSTGTITGGAQGVYFGAKGGTFTNAGTVVGSIFAVNFSAYGHAAYRLIADPGAVFSGAIAGGNGVLELASGSSTGALDGFGSTITNFSALQIDSGADWRLAGSVGATTIDNQGTVEVGGSGSLDIGAPISASAGSGVIEAGASGTISIGAVAVSANQTFNFADDTGILELAQPSSFQAPIQNFAIGNTIDLTSITADAASWSNGSLTVTDSGSNVATLAMPGDYSAYVFGVSPDGGTGSDVAVTATCYAAGTRIMTPTGEVPIERLHRDDMVMTVSGRPQPIHWIGHRCVNFRRHPNRQRILPVRIVAQAFGPGRPKRALLLSPDHAVYIEGVLIPIRHLINGTTIAQIERQTITYYHIELPQHDVLIADGMPAETYLEAGARSAFANGDVVQLRPEFTPPQDHYAMLWEQYGYAPLVVTGETLDRVRASLAAGHQRAA
jgi:hypothetical protein